MSVIRLEIRDKHPTDKVLRLTQKARDFGLLSVEAIELADVYKLKSVQELSDQVIDLFVDPILQSGCLGAGEFHFSKMPSFVAEVYFRPGVTDNSAHSASETLSCIGEDVQVARGSIFFFQGVGLDESSVAAFTNAHLANPLIQEVRIYSFDTWKKSHWELLDFPEVEIHHNNSYETIPLNISDDELEKLSRERCLALTLGELHFVREYFNDSSIQNQRSSKGLPLEPTDVELEVIAQSWSEHCKHKIFAAHINYEEGDLPSPMKKLGNVSIDSLFKSKIRKATLDVKEKFQIPWLISVFSDNAGIVRFDPELDLCIKVETHNSPSALDPYGGALTGILGVNRDILGCGYGARPVANMDVFCFADPDYPLAGEEKYMPADLLTPAQLLEGVHQGVEDGGNKSGIPTINGAIHFDQDYAGKPLVFVGTVGAMPANLKSGIETFQKNARAGDLIYMVGGAIGADGIHGATFSSLELNESSPSTAVQIGDPLTQKRVLDFLIEARDLELFTCVTDNGAGGLSSSVGEMATLTGGARIDLARAPTKYQGLAPWELMISESQERMTFAVAQSKSTAFEELARKRSVSATALGNYTDDGLLSVFYAGKLVGELGLEWLHDALPQMQLNARYDGARKRNSWRPSSKLDRSIQFSQTLTKLLSAPNVTSKEGLVRRYDHEVGAATALKPFGGEHGHAPNDSGALWLGALGGSSESGVSVSCGLAPKYSLVDPYLMAIRSVDECVRGMVATGADIERMCILDNFCWPDPVKSDKNPDGDIKLGELVRTCQGLYDISLAYGLPLVSGKDSMKNDYRGKNKNGESKVISILPTLLVTGMAHVQMKSLCDSSFKKAGDLIYLIGGSEKDALTLVASEYSTHFDLADQNTGDELSYPDLDQLRIRYQSFYQAHQKKLINSAHDISEGGLAVSIFESMLGRELGAQIKAEIPNDDLFWFGEGVGSFVVTINPDSKDAFESHFKDQCLELGVVTKSFMLERGAIDKTPGNILKKSFLSRWP